MWVASSEFCALEARRGARGPALRHTVCLHYLRAHGGIPDAACSDNARCSGDRNNRGEFAIAAYDGVKVMSIWAVHISHSTSGRAARHGGRLLGVGRSALVVVLCSLLGGCASISGPSHESARKAFEEGNVKEAAKQYKQLADEANSPAASWMYGVIRYHGSGDVEAAPEEALPYLKQGESYYAEELRSEYYSARKQAVYDTILDWQSEGYTGTSGYRVNNAYKLLEYYHPSPGSDDPLSASRLKVLRFWAARAEAEHLEDKPMTTGGTREVWVDLDLSSSIAAALDKISPQEAPDHQSEPRDNPELARQFREIATSRREHEYINSPNRTCREPYVTAFWTWQAARHGEVRSQYRMWQLYDFDALEAVSQHDADEFSNSDNLINCWTNEDTNQALAHKWLVIAANNGHEDAMSRATALVERGEIGDSPGVPALDIPTRTACYVPEGETKFTAFQNAAMNDDVQLARCMLERNAELDAKDRLREETHLHRAARHGSLGVVKLLVDRGARVNARDKVGRTPLHGAAYKGHVEIVDYLVEHARGIGLNAIDEKDHRTALHFAALEGRREVAELLLAAGADPTIQSDDGTARAVALASNNDSVAELLAEHGVKDIRCRVSADAAFDAVATGSLTAARCQFSHGVDFDTRNDEGGTAFHVAARNNSVAVARWLADEAPGLVSARDGDEQTPLHVAAFMGHDGVVRTLVEHGAHVDSGDASGATPLHAAARGYVAEAGRVRVTEILLAEGAQADKRDSQGVTPLEIAASAGAVELAEVLANSEAYAGTAGAARLVNKAKKAQETESGGSDWHCLPTEVFFLTC